MGEPGWVLSGGAHDAYVVTGDTTGGRPGWLLSPIKDTYGHQATSMRQVPAADYLGKRVRIIAEARTRGATHRVDFWARVQAKNSPGDGTGLEGDWQELPVDSDWTPRTFVLDVPAGADRIEYGVGVAGPGEVWVDKPKLEIVGTDVPLSPGVRGTSMHGASATAAASAVPHRMTEQVTG